MNLLEQIKLAQNGEKDAFVFLVKTHEKALYRIAKSILKNDDDCADAIQETILNLYKNIGSLKHPEFFKTWLIRILINNCNKIIKNTKKVISIAEYIEKPNPNSENEFELVEMIELTKIIKSLPENLRVIITLYYFEDIAIKDIAYMLSIPEGTVKSRLARARTKIGEALNKNKWGVECE